MNEGRHRTVRSFVRRAGRITTAQSRAIRDLWSRFGVERGSVPLDLDALFGRRAKRYLEIGFGNGETLTELAVRHPDRDYLGVEVYEPGIGRLLLALEERDLANVRVMAADAVEVLEQQIPDASLDGVFVFFPDPWPKKRHHKRRLIQPPFVSLIARKLKAGAILHLATDWKPYAEQMLAILEAGPCFDNTAGTGAYAQRPDSRPATKFERRGERLGFEVRDLLFRRNDKPAE